jgi:hypothetical protein
MDDKGQMMVLESVIFAITVLISLIFIYQSSPSSTLENKYTNDLKLQGDNALRSLNSGPIDNSAEYPIDFPSNKLIFYLLTNSYGSFISDLNDMLPKTVDYNIYISNGVKSIFWCSSNYKYGTIPTEPAKTIEPVSKSHYLIGIDLCYRNNETHLFSSEVKRGKYFSDRSDLDHPSAFGSYKGSSYDVILEMWSIP